MFAKNFSLSGLLNGNAVSSPHHLSSAVSPGSAYAGIGGMDKELARVREMVELPLRYPELFKQLGLDAPKGLLLYGPPGCGKTLLARAVAQEAGIHFINVNSAEIIRQHYGQSEQMLRDIFAEAEQYPASVIFFDEIDAMAPGRDSVLGEVEKRIVSQLLTLLDGLKSRGNIIVIGATNMPNLLDPALRRPGRLDREIELHPPDKAGRHAILEIHTRNTPLAKDVDLWALAEKTPGFTGADLAALVKEAGMACLRAHDLLQKGLPTLSELRITEENFRTALAEISLSITRDVDREAPEVHWADIGGLDREKQILQEVLELPLRYEKKFQEARIEPPRGILLTGKSGTGKTMLAHALATESNVNFLAVKGPELLSKWVGDSEKALRKLFRQARQSAPAIIFFDEIDSLVPERRPGEGGSRITERLVGQFLVELDALRKHHVLVLAATNRPDLLDKALLRPGRFDYVLELSLPDEDNRLAILQACTRERPLAADVQLAELAGYTEGFSGAEIASLCNMAAMQSLKENLASGDLNEKLLVTQRHFMMALENFRQSAQQA